MYSILSYMNVAEVNDEKGSEVLETAHKFNLTFYDAAYLIEAKKNSRILISDDIRLGKVAESLGVETLASNTFVTI